MTRIKRHVNAYVHIFASKNAPRQTQVTPKHALAHMHARTHAQKHTHIRAHVPKQTRIIT